MVGMMKSSSEKFDPFFETKGLCFKSCSKGNTAFASNLSLLSSGRSMLLLAAPWAKMAGFCVLFSRLQPFATGLNSVSVSSFCSHISIRGRYLTL